MNGTIRFFGAGDPALQSGAIRKGRVSAMLVVQPGGTRPAYLKSVSGVDDGVRVR